MGRYYTGDIEGKFWFAVQPSDDASFFGGSGGEPTFLSYYFDAADERDIEEGLAKCRSALGDYKTKLDDFMTANNGYNEMMLIHAGFPEDKIQEVLIWYARLELGEKILSGVNAKGSCSFDAEL